jgi:hypothetical protein
MEDLATALGREGRVSDIMVQDPDIELVDRASAHSMVGWTEHVLCSIDSNQYRRCGNGFAD